MQRNHIELTPNPQNAGIKYTPSESCTELAISEESAGSVNRPKKQNKP